MSSGSSSPYPWRCAHDPLSGLEPHAVYWSLTVKALPLLDLVLRDSVARAFNQQLLAPGAIGIGFFAHHIAEVDITQPRFLPDLVGPAQGLHRGTLQVVHLVLGIETADMPGNGGIDSGIETLQSFPSSSSESFWPGNDKGCDFDPDTQFFHRFDALEHRSKASLAELPIIGVVK